MPIMLEFSLIPLDRKDKISRFVSETIEIIKSSGLPYQLGAMSACIEGEWDQVMSVAKQCFDKATENSEHVHIDFKIIWRKGTKNRLACRKE
ncbi:thiamine-binding protein [Solidesulfovibrio alcoholivorans]|uniref:thiamine-binding protein n=1 Tax=Solidesulfovibrio alcoholivorans TaxID=81406 RepID=UPI000694A4D7|nr:thiamine-binding protein [Solidesulfovibrio alcoholivorans]